MKIIKLVCIIFFLSDFAYSMTITAKLKSLYPAKDVVIEDKYTFFAPEEKQKIKKKGFTGEVPGYISSFSVFHKGKIIAYAYAEKFIFRGSSSVLLIIFDSSGSLHSIVTMRNYGLSEYHASAKWLSKFKGADNKKRKINSVDALSGATITDSVIRKGLKNYLIMHNIILKKTK